MKTFPVRGKRNSLVVNAPLDAIGCGVLCNLAVPQSPENPESPSLGALYFEFFPVAQTVGEGGETTYLFASATEYDSSQVPIMPAGVSSVVIQQLVGGTNELFIEVQFSEGDARTLYGKEYRVLEPGGDGDVMFSGYVSNFDLGPHAIRIAAEPPIVLFEEGLAQPYKLLINPSTGGPK